MLGWFGGIGDDDERERVEHFFLRRLGLGMGMGMGMHRRGG